jgi:hypothetical protein
MTPQQLAFAWDPRGGFSGDRQHRDFTSPEAAAFGAKTCSRSPNALEVPASGAVTLLVDSFKGQGDGKNLAGGFVEIVDFGKLQAKLGVAKLPQGDELKAAIAANRDCVLATVPVTQSGAIEISSLPPGAQIGVVANRSAGDPPFMARIATAEDLRACQEAGEKRPQLYLPPPRARIDMYEDVYDRRARKPRAE